MEQITIPAQLANALCDYLDLVSKTHRNAPLAVFLRDELAEHGAKPGVHRAEESAVNLSVQINKI